MKSSKRLPRLLMSKSNYVDPQCFAYCLSAQVLILHVLFGDVFVSKLGLVEITLLLYKTGA